MCKINSKKILKKICGDKYAVKNMMVKNENKIIVHDKSINIIILYKIYIKIFIQLVKNT